MKEAPSLIPHLLLIDDDEDEYRILSDALQEAGIACQVTWAMGPQHGLAILKYFIPQFIFMDYRMPKMNGLECMAAIQDIPAVAHIPVVLYSNEIDPSLCQKAMEAGVLACLHKSSDPAALSDELKKLFMNKTLHEEIQKLLLH